MAFNTISGILVGADLSRPPPIYRPSWISRYPPIFFKIIIGLLPWLDYHKGGSTVGTGLAPSSKIRLAPSSHIELAPSSKVLLKGTHLECLLSLNRYNY